MCAVRVCGVCVWLWCVKCGLFVDLCVMCVCDMWCVRVCVENRSRQFELAGCVDMIYVPVFPTSPPFPGYRSAIRCRGVRDFVDV